MERNMKTEIHAGFDTKESVIHAVESLLLHGVSEEDVTLILPDPQTNQDSGGPSSTHVQPEVVAAPKREGSAIIVGGEEGLGVGFGLGLLTAMCIPGIGMIAGSAAIIAALVSAGALIGGIAGGIYGYLIELEIPHEVAVAMADHISSGGATLSVNAADAQHEEIILKTLTDAGGSVI